MLRNFDARLAATVRDCRRSRTAWLLASLHAAWFVLAIANMSPPAPGLGQYLDRGGWSSATLLAGRPFHFHYESVALRFLFTVDIPAIAGPGGAGMQAQDPPAATIRARTQLVLAPVIITDGAGAHVSGLKKEDFAVNENGKPQRLAVFEEVKASPETHVERAAMPPGTYSNLVPEQTPKRLVIIAIDTINTPLSDQAYGRKEITRFLYDNLDPGAMIALLSVGRRSIRVVHDFSTDPKVLVAALRNVRGQPDAVSGIAAQAADADAKILEAETDAVASAFERWANESQAAAQLAASSFQQRLTILDTLAAIQEIARAYAGVPGRKSLIWATSGFPFTIDEAASRAVAVASAPISAPEQGGLADIWEPRVKRQVSGVYPGQETGASVLPEYEKTWRILNDSNMAVYPVDVSGLVVGTVTPASAKMVTSNAREALLRTTRQQAQSRDSISTMRAFADMTGGRAFYNANDLERSLRNAAADSSAYYLVGYYLKDNSNGWHQLRVTVNRPGVHVRSRSGFFVSREDKNPAATSKDDVQSALASPLDSTALPLMAKLLERTPAKNSSKTHVSFRIMLPARTVTIDESDGNHVRIEFVAVARTAAGEDAGNFAQTIEGRPKADSAAQIREHGLSYNGAMDLAPGEYHVRIVVRDALSGRTGSLTVPLKIGN